MARCKGQSGELEMVRILRRLTGLDTRRRVRQHQGDSDLDAMPPFWCAEIKRHSKAPRASIEAWWRQAVQQADAAGAGESPVLFFRQDRDQWRAVWPSDRSNESYEATIEGTPETWWLTAGSKF